MQQIGPRSRIMRNSTRRHSARRSARRPVPPTYTSRPRNQLQERTEFALWEDTRRVGHYWSEATTASLRLRSSNLRIVQIALPRSDLILVCQLEFLEPGDEQIVGVRLAAFAHDFGFKAGMLPPKIIEIFFGHLHLHARVANPALRRNAARKSRSKAPRFQPSPFTPIGPKWARGRWFSPSHGACDPRRRPPACPLRSGSSGGGRSAARHRARKPRASISRTYR